MTEVKIVFREDDAVVNNLGGAKVIFERTDRYAYIF
jgi:hypothetical protein